MEILNLSGNDGSGAEKSSKSRAFIGIGVIAAAVGLSSTLAANISINAGPVEFGQGVAQTVACSGDESVIVTPATSFTNAPSSVAREATFYGGDTFTVTSTADLSVGMVLNLPTNPEYVITEINGSEVRMSYQGPNEGTVLPVTFSPSRGTEQTITPNVWGDGGEIGESNMELPSEGIEAGMLVSGPGIAAQTVVVGIGNGVGEQYIELSKDIDYTSGELTFTNSGQSSFELSDITVSNIPDTCTNKVFTIKIYDNESSEPLKISNWDGGDSSMQVWWANGYQSGERDSTNPNEAVMQLPTSYRVFFDNMSTAYNDGYAFETNQNNQSIPTGAFKINLPITVDATKVYKITVETQDDSDSLNLNDYGWSFYGFWQEAKMR
jgi:hypothetical protein